MRKARRAQQNPPEGSSNARYVRVIHPNHPLAGQLVRVVRQGGHAAHVEGQWIIELAGQTRAGIPLSWAVLVEEANESEPGTTETEPEGLWADVTALLNLVRMVRDLNAHQLEEVASDELCHTPSQPVGESRPAIGCAQPTSPSGAIAAGAPTRTVMTLAAIVVKHLPARPAGQKEVSHE